MKRLIIGDIHGCYAELQELLAKAGLSTTDEIIALGDVVDRGPDSPRVLEFFREQPNARTLLGNHERKHVRSFAGAIRPALSQRISRWQIGEAGYADACAFMDGFERFIELPEAILVHGAFESGVALADQHEMVITGTMSGERHLRNRSDREWYELYDGAKPIVVGHREYHRTGEPLIWKDRVFGIDTGCCHGRALTGLLLPDFRVVSVPSRANHWARTRRSHAHVTVETAGGDALPWKRLEDLIGWLEARPERTTEQGDLLARLQTIRDEGDRTLAALQRYVMQENVRIMAGLRAECAFDDFSPAEQGSLYAERIGVTPLAKFLHSARRGELSTEALQRRLKTPRRLAGFAAKVGVVSAAGAVSGVHRYSAPIKRIVEEDC
ncbi:MAG: metallophosphoesterase [Deltaproteobacteria bacterium]|nr:metallophosphoesterase [Deltaproteobacteria bacterium]